MESYQAQNPKRYIFSETGLHNHVNSLDTHIFTCPITLSAKLALYRTVSVIPVRSSPNSTVYGVSLSDVLFVASVVRFFLMGAASWFNVLFSTVDAFLSL